MQKVAAETWHATYADILSPSAIDNFLKWAYSEYSLRQTLNSAGLWVLERAGEVVGYIRLSVRDSVGQLGAIYVLPSLQRQGLGHKLWSCALAWFEARGVVQVELTVAEGNHIAQAFYKKLGFEAGELKRSSLSGEPLVERIYRYVVGG
ncbi:MAG: GNAT family N-acetyltransferase [Trueperaceae bacterium]|nr:MAG: GNAT family N-acetyltransferase [Trueperaceae bacterium]